MAKPDKPLNRLKQDLAKLKDAYNPHELCVFGSSTREEVLIKNGVEVIVVSSNFNGIPFLERIVKALELISPDYPIDLLCYTPQEFERKKRDTGILSDPGKKRIYLLDEK